MVFGTESPAFSIWSALLNHLPVTVLPAAASDRQGVSRLYLSEEGKASNSLRGNGVAKTVIAVTLDSLLDHFPAPQVLKIDVEGSEYAVLSGARRVLRQARPLIFCEVTSNHEAIGQLLTHADLSERRCYVKYGLVAAVRTELAYLHRVRRTPDRLARTTWQVPPPAKHYLGTFTATAVLIFA